VISNRGNYLSRSVVANNLKQSTRKTVRSTVADNHVRIAQAILFDLAPHGVYQPNGHPVRWWALTPPFHPYLTEVGRFAFCCTFRRLAQNSETEFCGYRLPVRKRAVLWSSDFPHMHACAIARRPTVSRSTFRRNIFTICYASNNSSTLF